MTACRFPVVAGMQDKMKMMDGKALGRIPGGFFLIYVTYVGDTCNMIFSLILYMWIIL